MDTFCREQSIEAEEPLTGTAVADTDVWLLAEYDQPWRARAVAESSLPDVTKAALLQWQDEIDGARVQLIRGGPGADHGIVFMLAMSTLGRASVHRWVLPDHEALAAMHIPAIVAAARRGQAPPDAQRVAHAVVLVCTNGRRDRCCAKWGLPLFTTLAGRSDLECWQTTHLGGHRFAPTALTLPNGLCYGRLPIDDAEAFGDAVVAGQVYRLETLRGRTCLSASAQAAECEWREHTGELRVAALTRVVQTTEGSHSRVALTDAADVTHEVSVERNELGRTAKGSCAKEPVPVRGWTCGPVHTPQPDG